MPRVNPEILVWAREAAGLTQEVAAKKLGFQDTARSFAADKLAAIEYGQKEPSRPQLLKMASQYRRPLLTFYLSKPPAQVGLGVDFRTLPTDRPPHDEGLLDALVTGYQGTTKVWSVPFWKMRRWWWWCYPSLALTG